MGLGLAGAISGAGNAMTQGLQTLNSGIVQMGVQQSLAQGDREFQLKKMTMQQEFERAMQTEKIGADRQNTMDTIAATGIENRKTVRLTNQAHEDLADLNNKAADARQEKQLAQQQTLEVLKLGVTKEIHDQDREALEGRFKQQLDLDKQKVSLDKDKVHPITTGDGRIALMSSKGKALGYLTDGKGQEIKAPTDLPKTAQVEINALVDEMHDMSREYAKAPMHTPEQETAYKAAKEDIRDRIAEVLQPYTGGKKADPPPKKPIVMPSYKNKGAQSKAAPPPAATPNDQPIDWKRTLVPGYGLMERFYKQSQPTQ